MGACSKAVRNRASASCSAAGPSVFGDPLCIVPRYLYRALRPVSLGDYSPHGLSFLLPSILWPN
jgi:hypothetical protein